MKGWKNWFNIPFYKIGLWILNLPKPDILRDNQFILGSKTYPSNNLDLFYLASYQFVDYLAHKYDIYTIYQKVVNGDEFTKAFKETAGKSIELVYNEWREYYFRMN